MSSQTVDDLIAAIKDKNEKVRTEAWVGAGPRGAPAVKPLAALTTHQDIEVARAAGKALWKIVRHVGRPGADDEKKAAVAELLALLGGDRGAAVRREVLWMLSEIGGDESVDAMAALLGDAELREDARMALQRIPGDKSLSALRARLEAAGEDFKINIAESLRARGVEVPHLPSRKLVPCRQTLVKPL